jgi:hypothetical protein
MKSLRQEAVGQHHCEGRTGHSGATRPTAFKLTEIDSLRRSCLKEAMLSEWQIKSRSHSCARTQARFSNGEVIYTLLFREGPDFRREDISEAAWLSRPETVEPFSFWKSTYEDPPPAPPEPLPKESVEAHLRQLIQEDQPEKINARYILALMLERKKTLKQVDVRENGDERILIYEHAKTGEVFLILDPRLQLDQIDAVQNEVYAFLAPRDQFLQPEQ